MNQQNDRAVNNEISRPMMKAEDVFIVPFEEYFEFKNERFEHLQAKAKDAFQKALNYLDAFRRDKKLGAVKPDSVSCDERIKKAEMMLDALFNEAHEINRLSRKHAVQSAESVDSAKRG